MDGSLGSSIYECGVVLLSLESAKKLVPPEFAAAYSWFTANQNQVLPQLPFGKGLPEGFDFPLARQAGIFSPDYRNLPSKGDGKKKYALSIHSEGQKYYDDKDVINRDDGTWSLEYCAHRTVEGKQHVTGFNDAMMNNLRDGVPVAVMVKEGAGGYRNYGLAYIEEYNPYSDVFSLHGPVEKLTEDSNCFAFVPPEQLSDVEREILYSNDVADDRRRVVSERVQREGQAAFSRKVFAAYEGTCALTEVAIPQVLQAAHIDRYRGRKSQIVANGILLRADIHLLYDANLLGITPEGKTIVLSERLRGSPYRRFDNARISLPARLDAQPDEALLEMHFKQFLTAAL